MPLLNDAGDVIAVLGSARDVTERRRLEASLRQAQKMEALGQLADGVAHFFNNLLTGMLGCLDLLNRQVTSERARMLIEEGRRTVERGTGLTRRLLAFSRQQPLATQTLNCNGALTEMRDLLGRTLDNIRVSRHFAPDLWSASADRNQIELAILNLAINARDAMPLGGSLVLETRNGTLAAPQEDGLAPGDYVAIAVTDTGSGMSPETLARAVDPFFTTKAEGKGTGLGLSMVYGMVRQLGGGMRLTSELGQGTCVTLLLPRAAADGRALDHRVASQPGAAATILLVSADPDTQDKVTAYAAELGLDAVMAGRPDEALALLDSGVAPRILIAEATLPGMSGPALIASAQARCGGLAGLILSGARVLPLQGGEDALPRLQKPFDRSAFSRAIQPLLPARTGTDNVIPVRFGPGARN